ncbi:hypothetical protein KFE25_009500 [Diacronema lutheri]|uniref:Uncharacterized protein n=1 Tax=Diacronema lutheri TaxID=2081491 RepID=A0A8J5Y5E6_DIALT|nr:hypothetical protein KFE25_009500 [Diacronema lutheri]
MAATSVDCTAYCNGVCAAQATDRPTLYEQGFGQGMADGMLWTIVMLAAVVAFVLVGRVVGGRLRRRPNAGGVTQLPNQYAGF